MKKIILKLKKLRSYPPVAPICASPKLKARRGDSFGGRDMLQASKGFTLMELLVAMSIFMIGTTLAVGSFVTTSAAQRQANLDRQTQQMARLVLERISRDIRNANGWVDSEGNRRKIPPFVQVTGGNRLYLFSHDDANFNFLTTYDISGQSLVSNISLKENLAGDQPSFPPPLADIFSPLITSSSSGINYVIPAVTPFAVNPEFQITSELPVSPSFSSLTNKKTQPSVAISLTVTGSFGKNISSVLLQTSIASRDYGWKYVY